MMGDISRCLIEYFENDVRRINHAMKVASFARSIALEERVSEKELLIIEICGYLHDVGIKLAEEKYQSSSGKLQEELGPDIVKTLLNNLNIEDDILARICYIIGNHHSYNKIDGIDFQILVEADFIVNIYEDNVLKREVEEVNQRIFRTITGKSYLKHLYLSEVV
nr:HD domain-containing protein [Anaeromicropila herbilytica]